MQPNGCIMSPWTRCSRRSPIRRPRSSTASCRKRTDARPALRTPGHVAAGGDETPGIAGRGQPRGIVRGAGARSCTTSTRSRSTRSPSAGSANSSAAGCRRSPNSKQTGRSADECSESRFVYVTYIRTTPERVWRALIDPEFTRQYWADTWQDCDWKPGARGGS